MGVLVLILILCQGRTRIETIGVILFCALMTTVAVQLLIESGRTLGTCKTESEELYIIPIIFVCIAITSETPVQYTPLSDNYFSFLQGIFDVFCMRYRKYPSVHVFFVSSTMGIPRSLLMVPLIDHRNDIVVTGFGLIMSVVGDKFIWYLDPIGAICIALLILVSWISNAFEQIWLLVGKAAPQEFIAKLIYMSITYDEQISMVETVSSTSPCSEYALT